jgi:plasmid stabilization system protein ParE
MKVNWTQKGRQRLQQLYDYISTDQPDNALNYVDKITRRVELLAMQPRSGKVVEKYLRDDIREIYEGDYRIIYRILVERIDILTVRHSSRLLPNQLHRL